MVEVQEDLKFFVNVCQSGTIDSTLQDLKNLVGNDFSLVRRHDHINAFVATSSPAVFERLFGVKPQYSAAQGWEFDVNSITYPLSSIEQVHPNYRTRPA